MKRKEIKKLHQLSIKELKEMLSQVEKELIDLKMSSKREKVKDVRAMAKKRDDLARIKTILREKEFLEEGKQKNEKI